MTKYDKTHFLYEDVAGTCASCKFYREDGQLFGSSTFGSCANRDEPDDWDEEDPDWNALEAHLSTSSYNSCAKHEIGERQLEDALKRREERFWADVEA